jgi:hypothetical protein
MNKYGGQCSSARFVADGYAAVVQIDNFPADRQAGAGAGVSGETLMLFHLKA